MQDKEAACPATGTCGLANLNSTSSNDRTLPGGLATFALFTDSFVDDRTLNSSRVGIANNVGFTGTAAGLNQASGSSQRTGSALGPGRVEKWSGVKFGVTLGWRIALLRTHNLR